MNVCLFIAQELLIVFRFSKRNAGMLNRRIDAGSGEDK